MRERAGGNAARLAGDDLLGAGPAYQAAVVAAAIADQTHLDVEANDEIVLDITGRAPPDVVADMERLLASRKL